MSITLHMAASLDGYVANKENDFSWMEASWSPYEKGIDMDPDFVKSIDAYIMGSKTYELALKLGWPYADTPVIVVTKRKLPLAKPTVEFFAGDFEALVKRFSRDNAWLVGGPTLAQEFLRAGHVDKVCLTVIPIILGGGLPLVKDVERKLRLKEVSAFKNGMIDLTYDVVP